LRDRAEVPRPRYVARSLTFYRDLSRFFPKELPLARLMARLILEHLGLPTTGTPIAPARISAAGEDAPWRRATRRAA